MSATAIILARAGSVGVPGKNVADVAGRPCIAWTIEAARLAERVGRVVVSSDDGYALEIGRRTECEVVERPAALATSTATVDDAARHAYGAIGEPPGPVVLLYANVPVRPAGLIDRAVETLERTGADSVQSYAPVGKHHPWWTARLDAATGAVRAWEGEVLNHGCWRRQDLPAAFVPDGGVIALTPEALMLRVGAGEGPHAFFGVDRRGIVSDGCIVDIDESLDLVVADAVLRQRLTTEGTEGTEEGIGIAPDDLTKAIIGCAMRVHSALGPGLLESVYELCLFDELCRAGHSVARQVVLPVRYGGRVIEAGLRLDMVVDRSVILELKAVDKLTAVHEAQLLTYLRLSGIRTGLLLNFNTKLLRHGLKRMVL